MLILYDYKLRRLEQKKISVRRLNKGVYADYMKLKNIIKTKSQIEEMGFSVENNLIKDVNISIIAHYGRVVCLEVCCYDVYVMYRYNNTKNLGYILKAFVELFELDEDDNLRLTKIKNIPCRLVFEGGGSSRCIGFGHFMKDKFVLTDEFARIDE